MMQSPDDFARMVQDAAELAHRWEPNHPQYVEGRFYLTGEQWQAVLDSCPPPDPFRDGVSRAQAVWGIPVVIIQPNETIPLPSGKVLVYSKLLDAFYVFNESIARDAGITHRNVIGQLSQEE